MVVTKLTLIGVLVASSYGPGLIGNTTACGQTLTPRTIGVAHKTLKCGTLVRLCHGRKCADVKVIDRGPFSGDRTWDITEGTTKRVWGINANQWGVRKVRAFRIRKVKATSNAPAKRPTYPSHLRSTL
jgi:rare lipoprotein A